MTLDLAYALKRNAGGAPTASGRQDGDSELFERIARWTYALLEAQACERSNASYLGANYPALRDSRGKWHVSARTLAQRTGRQFTENHAAGRAVVSSRFGDVLLVLGCPEVKIGDTWRAIDGVVLADGEDVLIPLEIAQAIQ